MHGDRPISTLERLLLRHLFHMDTFTASPSHELLRLHDDLAVVIEDDPICRTVVKHTLESVGIRAYCASSWTTGRPLVEFLRPRLILIDGLLPQYDGGQIARAIRARFASSGILLVIMTAFFKRLKDESNLRENSTADIFIRKPFTPESLIRRLEMSIPGLSQRQPLASRLPASSFLSSEVRLAELMRDFDRDAVRHVESGGTSKRLGSYRLLPTETGNPDETLLRERFQKIAVSALHDPKRKEQE